MAVVARSSQTSATAPAEMRRRHLPPVMFLAVLLLVSLSFCRHLLLPSQSQPPYTDDDDALLRRLSAIDVGGDQIVADAAAMLSHASISSSPSHDNHRHLLLHLRRLPYSTTGPMLRLRVPNDTLPTDGSLLAGFRASLRAFLRAHKHRRRGSNNVAAVMGDVPGHLGLVRRFHTCAVVGNSGILLGAGRGAQIDAHDFVIRLNNAPVAGHARDVGARTSLTVAHSFVLHRCAAPSAATTPGCDCHPNGRAAPLAMYVSRPEHLLYVLACNATATPAAPFRLVLTDARLDALCARVAKYYSLRRFVAESGSPASGWARRRDGRDPYFHYSTGLQAVVTALGVCDRVSMFGFGRAAGVKHHYHTNRSKETEVHDYEAEYQFYGDLQARPEAVPFLGEAPGFVLPPVKLYW
ncbi:hypothetical protein BDA96_05G040200 [Sorghum bicolor]|uniref:Sialyltransferase-like protein n=1 Tax=Sorghum bicolor TaxID=4558 RepID=A0A921UEI9_SORBI|nr:sialyltransferase-like protein 2 [Sorghum bicolor]KAG0528759.1 hypothetical protein BDA96_05G040200 [Sorghum bicolor]|eukprot:XP_002449002.2 sialyltransferase-like protein 2 [Sorghum bicolor]